MDSAIQSSEKRGDSVKYFLLLPVAMVAIALHGQTSASNAAAGIRVNAEFDAPPDIAGMTSCSRGPATQSNAAGVPPTPTSTPGQYVQQSTISNGMQSLPGDTPGMVAHGRNQQVMDGNLPRVILTSQSIAKKDRRL